MTQASLQHRPPTHLTIGRGANKRLQREVNAFMVWRTCKQANWKASPHEVAEATGLTVETVRRICNERQWVLVYDDSTGSMSPVDITFREGSAPILELEEM